MEIEKINPNTTYKITIVDTITEEVLLEKEADIFALVTTYINGRVDENTLDTDTSTLGYGPLQIQIDLIKTLLADTISARERAERMDKTKSIEEIYEEGKTNVKSKK